MRKSTKSNRQIRWFAVITAGVAGIVGTLGFGLFFIAVSSVLLVGAILRGHWQRTGTWMMWLGAALLSLWTLPFGARILLSPPPIDRSGMSVIVATAVTLLLVVVCDIALAVEAFKDQPRPTW
jgi:hypothetical protein